MNTFERAKAKHEKNAAIHAAWRARKESAEQKEESEEPEEPKQHISLRPKEFMRVTVDGPVKMEFEVHYGGTLMASQMTDAYLKALFIKQLSVIGKVL